MDLRILSQRDAQAEAHTILSAINETPPKLVETSKCFGRNASDDTITGKVQESESIDAVSFSTLAC